MRRTTALLAALALLLTLFPAAALAAPSATGTWIVTLRAGENPATTADALARQHDGTVGYVYRNAINGFSFRGSAAAADALARNPMVAAIEADADVWLDTTQTEATWGLDRIDQRTLPLSGTYTYNTTGAGVTAYVIDSGILTSHSEFGTRASVGIDLVGTNGGQDCNGHGTHVAGTIGGETYGVAKAITLRAVRVFDCTGGSSWSTIIAGIDWVIANHEAGQPAVANMSLGGGASSSVDTATNNLINDGVATAVAAGNGNVIGQQANACNYSPARVSAAMTISATNSSDAKVSWANYGSCVDWFAPGVSIKSAWYTSTTATNTISGTSMATPHTAGVAALYLQANPGASPAAVRTAIYDATTKGVVTSSSTANNHLLYSLVTGGSNNPPTAGPVNLTVDAGITATWSPVVNDPDGDPLTCGIASQPGKGSATLTSCAANGGSYTANAGTSGSDSFTYTVGDGRGGSATGTVSVTINAVTEPPPPPGAIALDVNAFKVRGVKTAELSWTGASATSTYVDIVRNGTTVITTPNDGSYTETLGKGGGTYTYAVCEAGMSTCSNEVTVSY